MNVISSSSELAPAAAADLFLFCIFRLSNKWRLVSSSLRRRRRRDVTRCDVDRTFSSSSVQECVCCCCRWHGTSPSFLSFLFFFSSLLFFCFGLVSSLFVGRLQSDCDSSHDTLTVLFPPRSGVTDRLKEEEEEDGCCCCCCCCVCSSSEGLCLTRSLADRDDISRLVGWSLPSLSPPSPPPPPPPSF